MAQKRETLKFIRINARPSYLAQGSSDKTVIGKKNYWADYSKYDIESESFPTLDATKTELYTVNGTLSPAPFKFFKQPKDSSTYQNLVFVIDGLHNTYNRASHNLNDLSSKVYIYQSDGTVRNNSSGVIRKYTDQFATALSKSITFRVNPTNLKVNKKKLFKQIRTRGGWVFQHWGPDIGSIVINGVTGNISPDGLDAVYTTTTYDENGDVTKKINTETIYTNGEKQKPTVENSPALAKFREIEKWYDADQNEEAINNGYLTALQFRDRVYIGHIANFSFEEVAAKPFMLLYNLTFIVHYDASDLSSATSLAANTIVRNEETIELVQQLKGN